MELVIKLLKHVNDILKHPRHAQGKVTNNHELNVSLSVKFGFVCCNEEQVHGSQCGLSL